MYIDPVGQRVDVNELNHHGVLGMRWGIRRFQNKDGSLTAAGRARLGIDKPSAGRTEDVTLKKGTEVNRWVNDSQRTEMLELLRSPSTPKETKDRIRSWMKEKANVEDSKESKYVSVDNIRTDTGKRTGKEFYMSWFTNEGYEPENAHVNIYTLQKDVKIASAQKVMDAIVEEVGSTKITDLLKNNRTARDLTMEYTNNRELQNRINERFKKAGYGGVEDVNDPDTQMPVLLFDSNRTLGKAARTQSGKAAIDEYFKKMRG